MAVTERDTLHHLLDVGRALVSERSTEAVLKRILAAAREITGARYAALGVLDERRIELARFITSGLDHDATLRAVGELPRGRGVLGVLIEDARPLRLADVGEHPQSYGFPAGHPAMRSFLGVSIVIHGKAWGNLYLTEKQGAAEFSQDDEEAVIALAQYAATAIENARLYEASERRRAEAERAVRGLEAAQSVAGAVGGVEDLDRVLELIVKRGRALVDARAVVVMLRDGDELVIAASAGRVARTRGRRLAISGSLYGQVLDSGRPQRIYDVSRRLPTTPAVLGVADARTVLLVPMLNRGVGVGVLAAFDRLKGAGGFSAADEQLLRTFANQAANAVALRRSVETDRLRAALEAAEAERGRWARELHDQTLQTLGGVRVMLASARARGDAVGKDEAIAQSIEDIELEIANLRAMIADLRPALLDEIGLAQALEALIDRRRGKGGLAIDLTLELPAGRDRGFMLSPELQTTVYRLVQESLTNVVKHARARSARVLVRARNDELLVEVHDDGVGFDPSALSRGFGLVGMRERAYLAGGRLEVRSNDRGTLIQARLPLVAAAFVEHEGDRPGVQRHLWIG